MQRNSTTNPAQRPTHLYVGPGVRYGVTKALCGKVLESGDTFSQLNDRWPPDNLKECWKCVERAPLFELAEADLGGEEKDDGDQLTIHAQTAFGVATGGSLTLRSGTGTTTGTGLIMITQTTTDGGVKK